MATAIGIMGDSGSGKTTSALIMTGYDNMYLKAAQLEVLKTPYDEDGLPLSLRVGRHVAVVTKIIDVFSRNHPDREIIINGLPSYHDVVTCGLGQYF